MHPKRSKQQRKNYHFYCLCSSKMRYQTDQKLLNHIRLKHGLIRQMKDKKYQRHLEYLRQTYRELHPREEQQGPIINMRDIDCEKLDIFKMEIVDNTIFYFDCVKLFQEYANKEVNTAEQILQQGYTMRDIQIMADHMPELQSKYGLEELQEVFAGFQEYAAMKHGEKGKLIDMKKQLASQFSFQWALKIRLQIDLSTLRLKAISISQQLQRKIANCEEQMWKQNKQKVVRIINDYAQKVIKNHLLLKANRS